MKSVLLIALSDTMRPLLLIAFVLLLFAVAGLSIVLGKRHVARGQARALSKDAGVDKGAMRGTDGTFSDAWLNETRNEVDEEPRQSWADLLLGEGHHNNSPEIEQTPQAEASDSDWSADPMWDQPTAAPASEPAWGESTTTPAAGKHRKPFLVDSGLDED